MTYISSKFSQLESGLQRKIGESLFGILLQIRIKQTLYDELYTFPPKILFIFASPLGIIGENLYGITCFTSFMFTHFQKVFREMFQKLHLITHPHQNSFRNTYMTIIIYVCGAASTPPK